MYETQHGALIRSLDDAQAPLARPSVSPDGLHIAAGGADGVVRVWSAATGKIERSLDHPAHVVAFSPDGKRLATFGYGTNIQVWDTEKWEVMRRLELHIESGALRLAFSPDGKWIAAGSDSPRFGSSTAQQSSRNGLW